MKYFEVRDLIQNSVVNAFPIRGNIQNFCINYYKNYARPKGLFNSDFCFAIYLIIEHKIGKHINTYEDDCFVSFYEALEVIENTFVEMAGLKPIKFIENYLSSYKTEE